MSTNFIDLQKIILGKRKEPLSAMEIKEMFKYPTTPEFVLTLVKALNLKKIDPENTLIQAIANAKVKQDLIPIALALRYGADPNLYVRTCELGDIHILGFTYYKLSKPSLNKCIEMPDQTLINSIVMMLVASGSNGLLPIYNDKGNVIRNEFSLIDPIPGKNVIYWLCESGYDNILDNIDESLCNVKPESATLIGTFLDCLDMLKTDPKLEQVIASHAYQILNKFGHLGNPKSGIKFSIQYLNLNAFECFVNLGATIEYWQINNILLRMKIYKELKDLVSLSNLYSMLLYSVSNGTIMDLYQLKLLERIDPNLIKGIQEKYEEPYWKKVCKVCKGEVSHEMKLIAYHLNLNPEYPKKTLCEEISKITVADPEEVKKSAIERQKQRISSTLSEIHKYIGNENPQVLLRNKSILEDIYDFVDNDIVVYRDKDGVSWGFIRDQFTDLLDERKNPYNQYKLPINVTDELERKREYHILLGLPSRPEKVSETLDKLVKKDKIENRITEKTIKRFYNMASLEGISEDFISRLTKESLQNSLNNIGVITDLTDLNNEFAKITFEVSAENQLRRNKFMVSDFFSDLRMNSQALLGKF